MVRAFAVVIMTLLGGFLGWLAGTVVFGAGMAVSILAALGAVAGFWGGLTMKRPFDVVDGFVSELLGHLLSFLGRLLSRGGLD